MSKTLAEWIKEITEWQDQIFTQATPLSAVTHLQREVIELTFAIQTRHRKRETGKSDIEKELADCQLLLIGVAHLSGIDLETALEEKMRINRSRVWGEPDAQGVIEHVRDEPYPASEGSRFVGKTLLEVFEEEGILPPVNYDRENFLFENFKGEEDGTLRTD